jgi:predicted tellurium resistance membrane protein TerC
MLTVLSTILSITVLELMLSVDNALVNASLAEELPPKLQKKAIYFGIGAGAVLRIICLFLATIILENIAFSHFFRSKSEEKELRKHPHFYKVIGEIALADLVFSIDNVVGAVGISSHFSYVVFGVLIGITTMLFVTPIMLTLMNKSPNLIKTAYGVIGYVGLSILIDAFLHFHIPEIITFVLILTAITATMLYDKKMNKALL